MLPGREDDIGRMARLDALGIEVVGKAFLLGEVVCETGWYVDEGVETVALLGVAVAPLDGTGAYCFTGREGSGTNLESTRA